MTDWREIDVLVRRRLTGEIEREETIRVPDGSVAVRRRMGVHAAQLPQYKRRIDPGDLWFIGVHELERCDPDRIDADWDIIDEALIQYLDAHPESCADILLLIPWWRPEMTETIRWYTQKIPAETCA